ncbi:organic cation transporter protein isoform X2 [Arctopsyche grandis]
MHMLSLTTVAAVPDHRCAVPGVDGNTSALWNSTEIINAIPKAPSGKLESCLILDENGEPKMCDSWVYDQTYHPSSLVVDWNLVCDKRWMGALAQCLYMLGVFTGAVVLGGMADKVGRKKIFCISAVAQLILGVVVAFIPEFWSFLFVRFLYGIFGSAGSYITGFVLTMEIVGASKRTACGVAFQAAFAGGIMLVAGWGALIKDRTLLQVVYGLHSLILIPHLWVMDESPRWLWSQGRTKEAIAIVQKALRINDRGTFESTQFLSRGKAAVSKNEPAAGAMDLFKTPNLRKKTLNVCFCWFANSLVYYGLSLNAGKLYGNPFLMLFITGLVEFPSYIAIIYLLDRLGRRSLTSSLMLAGGVCCIVACNLTQGSAGAITIVMLGKLFIAGSFAIIYNYSAELFPTVVRNSALGLGSMSARLSGALTPLITLLDSLSPTIPAIIFGVVSIVSGFLTLFLPETNGQPMPQSIADGERFGIGDTCFTTCLGKKNNKTHSMSEPTPEVMIPLDNVTR